MSSDSVATPAALGTAQVMRTVLIALAPGSAAMLWYFGVGVLANIALTAACCIAFEAIALHWRGRALRPVLSDGSVLVSALLLALALPPGSGIGLIALGSAVAVLLAKHACGGFGHNLFNPAMAGYALLLVLFPAAFTHWPTPGQFDGVTGATTLEVFRQNEGQLLAAWWQAHPQQFGAIGGRGWEWINLAFLAGGGWLLYRRIFTWHIPLALLAALGLCAALFYDNGSSASAGSPLYHWFSGATMIGAFFIATEPVTAPRGTRARLLYGALIGTLLFAIRHDGRYADGVAFATLLGNAVAPWLDRLLPQPRQPVPETRAETGDE